MLLRCFYVSLALLCGAGPALAAAETENLEHIRQQVRQYLQQQYSSDMSPEIEAVKITVNNLDPRLRLAKCDKPLTLTLTDNGSIGGNVTVRTRCNSHSAWTIFVPARVDTVALVAVSSRSMSRGEHLQQGDIEMLPRTTSGLGSGFVADPARILGQELKRNINRGEVLRLSSLKPARVVKKGDALRVEAYTGTLLVVAAGIALADGQIGQQIKVKNTASERIIKARVVAPGRVQVML